MVKLLENCQIRQANSQDIWTIRWLVLAAFLDPTQLKVEQFWVIELDRKIIACGQIRTLAQAQELGSVVVKKTYRNQGLGNYLTQHLIEKSTAPLYVECLGDKLKNFYKKFGFVEVNFETNSPHLPEKFRVTKTLAKWLKLPLFIMMLK
ncbi:GNAT family N-acetyltransferase [Crocosphaera chwakensis]|uniref:Exodeoxyribonuclease VII large subunit n=1 Tax=Crocosphaera chwakensis CCY0110 TaxID=391612 RepID=A3IZI0_9CHRO|nr:GNAT family N-acetyltransferase [Crocosphaera chwakensis]EAZ88121.1 exodeoxyribonuclease VII large subunit [Crocosphaera chwakensis CCY0110]